LGIVKKSEVRLSMPMGSRPYKMNGREGKESSYEKVHYVGTFVTRTGIMYNGM